ncbi:MAG: hypothetical protein AAGK32_20945, partial [Actinomycetota bacterium]
MTADGDEDDALEAPPDDPESPDRADAEEAVVDDEPGPGPGGDEGEADAPSEEAEPVDDEDDRPLVYGDRYELRQLV